MALSYYDPLSDLYLGVPCPRDPWGVCQWSPMARWGESLVPKVLSVPLVKYSANEIVSDKDKFQVSRHLNLASYLCKLYGLISPSLTT
jgi:hypothetical protein